MDAAAIFKMLAEAEAGAAESDPFSPFADTAEGIGQLLIKQSPQFDMKDNLLAGLITGLAGGFAENRSNDYRSQQKDFASDVLFSALQGGDVLRPEGMNASVFAPLETAGSLFALQNKLSTEQASKDEARKLREIALTELVKNPAAAPDILAVLDAVTGAPARTKPMVSQRESVTDVPQDTLGLGPTFSQKLDAGIEEGKKLRLTPNAALEYAQGKLKPDILANTQAEKRLDALRKSIDEQDQLAAVAEAGVAGAGETGGLGILNTGRDLASKLMAAFGSEDQQAKQTAQTVLDSIGPKVISSARPPGSGAMSDRETQLFLGAGPSSNKTPEQNRALIANIKAASNYEKEYLNFLEMVQAQYGTTKGADSIWYKYKEANPPFVLQDGQYVPNTERPSFEEWNSGTLTTPIDKAPQTKPPVVPPGMKLQMNTKTGEYRLIPK